MSPADELQARHNARKRSRRITIIFGIVVMAAGYLLIAVKPGTSMDWVLLRVVLGFGCVLTGFVLAVLPLLGDLLGADDTE